jgi:predicted nucleotidyltransferase
MIAETLRRSYGAGIRVYLFGSVLDRDSFHLGSDLDIAVEGLDPKKYWSAHGEVETLAGSTVVDFVRFETADPGLRAHLRTEGEIL